MSSTKSLCSFLGGSHLYGMNTPESDIDERGVFLHTDPLEVYGFNRKRRDTEVTQSAEKDSARWELTQFLYLCTKSNTQTLEVLYAPHTAFTQLNPLFRYYCLENRDQFLDSEVLFKSLRGYLQNERRLALGERTGQLGGKRKSTIDKYGFSPKNFAHMMRLAFCGKHFFETGVYPVKFGEASHNGKRVFDYAMAIKTRPEEQEIEQMIAFANAVEADMVKAYEFRKHTFKPNYRHVSNTLEEFYAVRNTLP